MKSQYPDAARAIRTWIASHNIPPGAILPSARLLGEEIGFGRMITGFACNHLIASGHLYRKGYKLFVGSQAATRSPIEGTVTVASYYERFSLVAGRILTECGVKHRVVELSFTQHADPAPILRKLLAEKPAGLILWAHSWFESLRPVLASETCPMVICADGAPEGMGQSSAGGDLYRGMEKAVRHLHDLGHEHIAYLTTGLTNPFERELAGCYQKVCLQRDLRKSAQAIWQAGGTLEEQMRVTLLAERKRHPEVTALILQHIHAPLVMQIFRAPLDLSVVGIFDLPMKTRPALTRVALRDPDSVPRWACAEILSQIGAVESGRPKPPATRAFFDMNLIVGGTTRAILRHRTPQIPNSKSQIELQAEAAAKLEVHPWDTWRKTYAYLKRHRTHQWKQFDLSKQANHSMTREHGWLGGEALQHFAPGLRSIHGIPFQVIDEKRNGGHAVVTFQSPHSHTAGKRELPVTADLPVNGQVKALYFLHGCAHARPVPFAEYIVHFARRKIGGQAENIPLIPLGPSIPFALKQFSPSELNLQDWWNETSLQRDFAHSKFVTIFDPANPDAYERHLYTLEWINPRPKEAISRIEVRVDPDAGPVLALIAVTALL